MIDRDTMAPVMTLTVDQQSVKERVLTVIKPIPEVVETMLYKVFRRSEVEPRIDCNSISLQWPPSYQRCWMKDWK